MSNAEAWITGEYPNQKLNLKLPTGATGPQGPVGPVGPGSTVPGPANTLSVLETVTGPETAGATGPQGVKGDKGDPGGIVLGTTLGTSNLNDIQAPGVYRQNVAPGAGLNYPVLDLGVLIVHQSSTTPWTIQEYTPTHTASPPRGRLFYRRVYTTGTWSAWQVYASSRVDQTAGRAIYQWDDLNSREQLIYGDTGWRRVLSPGDIAGLPNMNAFIRRIGNEVEFTIYETTAGGTVSGAQSLYAVPAGFRYVLGESPSMVPGLVIDSGANVVTGATLYLASAGTYTVTLKAVLGTRHYSTLRWKTMESWPTTLPGTAYGSIPNL